MKWALASLFLAIPIVGGPSLQDGTEVDVDFPVERHQKNKGGSDGAGLCVFTSIGQAADWHGIEKFVDFRDYMTRFPGGGYPSKVDQYVKRLAQDRGIAVPRYLQIESNDLEIIADAVQRGHMVSVTYCRSPTGRYGGQRIAHMVNCVAARAGPLKAWAIHDNNYVGANQIEWMTETQFKQTYTGMGGGWAFIWLDPGPPAPLR
ncbi:MAG: hypothetical protein E6Q97_04345 [Desulfurellales bacterium]|nr:MAG: hypothetical protein E6Q97_04345 [Desulfurellales bacterium]